MWTDGGSWLEVGWRGTHPHHVLLRAAAPLERLGMPLPVQVKERMHFIESCCQKLGHRDPNSHLPFNSPPQDGDKMFPDLALVSTQNKSRVMKSSGHWSQTVIWILVSPPSRWVRLWAGHWISLCLSFLSCKMEIITVSIMLWGGHWNEVSKDGQGT